MARHEVIIHENPGLSELAPYTGNYISKETVNVKAFAEAVGAKCGLPAIQVISILGGSFDAFEALEREGLVRVHTDIGVICAVIKGSFPTADAAFDPAPAPRRPRSRRVWCSPSATLPLRTARYETGGSQLVATESAARVTA